MGADMEVIDRGHNFIYMSFADQKWQLQQKDETHIKGLDSNMVAAMRKSVKGACAKTLGGNEIDLARKLTKASEKGKTITPVLVRKKLCRQLTKVCKGVHTSGPA